MVCYLCLLVCLLVIIVGCLVLFDLFYLINSVDVFCFIVCFCFRLIVLCFVFLFGDVACLL